ncbi:MAG: ABC transporter permease [Clostridia bacterium]|nr:ABC transporter permease [Clostridia bacterium]
MTSKKYSADLSAFTYRRTFRSNLILSVLIAINIFMCFSGALNIIGAAADRDAARYLKATYTYFFRTSTDSPDIMPFMLSIPFIFLCAGLAVSIFRYVMGKKSSNVYFSLGISREKLFVSNYCAGLSVIMLGIIVPLAACLIANGIFFGFSGKLLFAFVYILFKVFCAGVFVFTLTALVMQLVGSVIETVVYTGVLLAAPAMVNYTLSNMIGNFIYGAPYTPSGFFENDGSGMFYVFGKNAIYSGLSMFDYPKYITPIGSDNLISFITSERKLSPNSASFYSIGEFKFPLVFALITSALAVAAYFCAKHRKAEKAGFMGTSPFVQGLCVLAVGPFLAMLAGNIFTTSGMSFPAKRRLIILLSIVIMAVGYTVVEMIVLRSFKKYWQRFNYLIAELGIFLLCCLVVISTLPVGSMKVPAAADIESASITVCSNDYDSMNGYTGPGYFNGGARIDVDCMGKDYIKLFEGFKDKEDIERIISVNEKLNALKNTKPDNTYGGDDEFTKTILSGIRIEYHLKNGKTKVRNYRNVTLGIIREIDELTKSDTMKNMIADSLETITDDNGIAPLSSYQYNIALISPDMTRGVSPELFFDNDARENLVKALAADIREGTLPISRISASPLMGYIVMRSYAFPTYDGDVYTDDDPPFAKPQGDIELIDNEHEEMSFVFHEGASYPVYADMKNTVEYVKANGLDKYFTGGAKPVKIIYGKYSEPSEISREYFDSMIFSAINMSDRQAQLVWSEFNKDEIYYEYSDGLSAQVYYPDYSVTDEDTEIDEADRIDPEDMMPEGSTVVTDEAKIAELMSKVRLNCHLCYEGDYALIVFDNGRITYAYIPEFAVVE